MSSWQLDPAGAKAVADAVAAVGLGLTDSEDPGYATSGAVFAESRYVEIGDGLNQGDALMQTRMAVFQLIEDQQANQQNIMHGISDAVAGVRLVTAIYENAGQLMSDQMAQAQREAVSAAGSGDFQYFAQGPK